MMLASSDITMANLSMRPFMEDEKKNARKLRYFFRLQCGHLREALRLVEKIENDPELNSVLGKCSAEGRAAFAEVKECAARPNDSKYRGFVHNVRNKVTAHYDPSMIEDAMERRASVPRLATSLMTLGEGFEDTDYRVASDIEETLLVRFICKVPDGTDQETATAVISDFLGYANGLALKYVQFCVEFVHRCMAEFGAVR
jgi:hypothetical protein